MTVRIKSASEDEIWYANSIGNYFEVVNVPGAFYYVPIPFQYYKNFSPFLVILKTDCEVINNGEK